MCDKFLLISLLLTDLSMREIAFILNYKNSCYVYKIMKNFGLKRDDDVKRRVRKRLMLEKFGVTSNFKRECVKEKYRKNCIEKYGVDHPMKVEEIKSRFKNSMIEKHGVDNPMKIKEIKNKAENTNIMRHGVRHARQNDEINERAENSRLKMCIEKYGVDNVMNLMWVLEKKKETCIEKYGVDHPMKSKDVIEKVINTCVERYGVRNVFMSNELMKYSQKKRRKTCLDKYGVEIATQSSDIMEKSYKTKKKNGSLKISKIQNELFSLLKNNFLNVEMNVRMNGWEIDFFVNDVGCFIQLDGIYWHGLDRSINTIKNSNKKIDKVIYKKILRDHEQNEWFIENNMFLIRLTDIALKNIINDNNFNFFCDGLRLSRKRECYLI